MGRKRRAAVEEPELTPFCYYCDREFEDEKVLIAHQKARHFKCSTCNKKMTTVGALVVHASQVHKESVTRVPNAKEGRQSLDVQVYGMEGVPVELMVPGVKRAKGAVDEEEGTAAVQGPYAGAAAVLPSAAALPRPPAYPSYASSTPAYPFQQFQPFPGYPPFAYPGAPVPPPGMPPGMPPHMGHAWGAPPGVGVPPPVPPPGYPHSSLMGSGPPLAPPAPPPGYPPYMPPHMGTMPGALLPPPPSTGGMLPTPAGMYPAAPPLLPPAPVLPMHTADAALPVVAPAPAPTPTPSVVTAAAAPVVSSSNVAAAPAAPPRVVMEYTVRNGMVYSDEEMSPEEVRARVVVYAVQVRERRMFEDDAAAATQAVTAANAAAMFGFTYEGAEDEAPPGM